MEGEGRSLAGDRRHRDLAVHQGGQTLADAEAQAGAAEPPRDGGVSLVEPLEQARARLGVEGELAFGVKDDTYRPPVSIGGSPIDVELNHSAAIYGVGFLPINPQADLFARVGYGTTEIEASAAGISNKADGESWNFGVGGRYFLDGQNGFRADYTRQEFQDDGGSADVWAVGYVRKF